MYATDRARTYGEHSGVWLAPNELRLHAFLVTVEGTRPIQDTEDLQEGAILRTLDGSWMEVFIADPQRGRYFCEEVAAFAA